MLRRLLSSLSLLAVVALPAAAQHAGGASPQMTTSAPKEAEQLAFLIGQWEVTVTPKINSLAARLHGAPSLPGTWKVWKAFDGFGVEDELRITDRSGNPNALTHSMRLYDAAQGKWTQTSVDVYRSRFTTATGEWVDGEFRLRSAGRDAEGRPFIQRVRFHDITPTSFKYQADRSIDGERTWEVAVLRIEARRVAATAPR